MQREIFNRAVEEFESASKKDAQIHAAVIAGDGWHRGVIGLAASKIAERLNRPCVVISLEGEIGHGSARSIEAYHLFNGLTACRDLLDKFGGHSHAAGLAIRRDRVAEFRRRLNEHAASCLTEEDLVPALEIDAEVNAAELNFQLSQDLRLLEPFGAGNPRPLFVTRGLRVLSEPHPVAGRLHKSNLFAGTAALRPTRGTSRHSTLLRPRRSGEAIAPAVAIGTSAG